MSQIKKFVIISICQTNIINLVPMLTLLVEFTSITEVYIYEIIQVEIGSSSIGINTSKCFPSRDFSDFFVSLLFPHHQVQW